MDRVTLRWDLLPGHIVPAAISAACPALTWLVLDRSLAVAIIGLVAAFVVVYVGLVHPLWLRWGLAVTLT